jgi:hypothetical protein
MMAVAVLLAPQVLVGQAVVVVQEPLVNLLMEPNLEMVAMV